MKRTLMLVAFGALACAVAQQVPTYTDYSKSVLLRATEFSFERVSNTIYRFKLAWPGNRVVATSKKQGIELYAPRIEAEVQTMMGVKGTAYIKSATAQSGIRAVRTGPGDRSEITGSTATYLGQAAGSKLTVSGPVNLSHTVGSQKSFAASGSSLVVDLEPSSTSAPLKTATLTGSVNIRIRQAAVNGTRPTDLVVTANRMVLNQAARPATVTLSGGVKMKGMLTGGSIDGVFSTIVLTLNEQGEVVGFRGGS